jgi:predicted DNA-binding protein
MVEIQFRTTEQRRIADLMWACQSNEEVNVLLRAFGVEAYVVREMLIAATYDEVEDVAFAQQVLKPFRLTGL